MLWTLNRRASFLAGAIVTASEDYRTIVHEVQGGGKYIDCGIACRGGLEVGPMLARVCMAGLANVTIVPGEVNGRPSMMVQVFTDHPVRACLASQYAGWAIKVGKYFAMGSGPMRAAAGTEAIYDDIGHREAADREVGVVGVLETRKPPTAEVIELIASACKIEPGGVTLLVAPTASVAGGVQIVARSVETALHKLHELKFDLTRIVSAHGTAPLPPVAADDLAAIGRTNDAILYGARVILLVTGDDASLDEIGHKVPSSSSRDHGEPFATIFARYNHDFYAVDPQLFSPAEVVFQNVETGKSHTFGSLEPGVLGRSFYL
jgi:methenyltetrahydromethanopterin cyclohydrolase